MPEPRLSVVIPTYNRCDSLRATLDALARQSFPASEFEVVVVSDGSTDGTDALLADYVCRAPFLLRPIRQQNGGPARARNRGIREANGELIVFLDDDVEPAPDFLAVHAARQAAAGTVPLAVIGPMVQAPDRRWHEPVWVAWEHTMLEKQYSRFRSGEWPKQGPNHFYSGNASLRREHLLSVGGFDENFPRQEDVELAYRLERECGMTFSFEQGTSVLHRPRRSFASWLAIPYAYGGLDVVRARSAEADADPQAWKLVHHQVLAGRNRITRLCAQALMSAPPGGSSAAAALLRGILVGAARGLYGMRCSGPAFALLSLAYNLRYVEGALATAGSARALREGIQSVGRTQSA